MTMGRQLASVLQRSRNVLSSQQNRSASQFASARWSNAMRAQSKVTTVDDPPTAPLPECHEFLQGEADFSNFLDRNDDISQMQAVVGLGSMLGICYALYYFATAKAKASEPLYTLREFPTLEQCLPYDAAEKKESDSP